MADNLQLELEIKGAEQVKRMLTNIGLDMKGLKGAMTDVGDHAKKYFGGQVFASRGGVLGKSWPRLSPGYAAQKAKRYPGRPMLVRTGVMERSLRNCQDLWIGCFRRPPFRHADRRLRSVVVG